MIYSKIWFSTTLFLQLIYVRNDSAEQQNSNISFLLIQMLLIIYNIQLLPFLFLLCMCLLQVIDFNNNWKRKNEEKKHWTVGVGHRTHIVYCKLKVCKPIYSKLKFTIQGSNIYLADLINYEFFIHFVAGNFLKDDGEKCDILSFFEYMQIF